MRGSSLVTTLLSIAAGFASGTAHASGDLLPGYNAVYEVYNRDRAVGEAEFSVTLLDAERGTYEFRSVSRVRGLYRLFVPRLAEELSVFVLDNGRIRPLSYSLRDGTRRDRNSFSVEFDWESDRATIMAGETRLEPQLLPGMLDRGSLRATLMLLDDDFSTQQLTLLDQDGPEIHELRADGEETLDTAMGRILTRKMIQQRLGSSRRTLIWLASELQGLPVRIERQNDGETRAAFQLEGVSWHE
ncbi:MAG: DUF3108 domain-containing protein [Rhodospirillaceae bacterium]|nr:DUF3108 domain-containing protein [Rhodospirillaceae bacterium]